MSQKKIQKTFSNPEITEKFASYPSKIRIKLLSLRELIFEVASKTKEVGKLEETLRWGEPSYLTTESKSGTMIRINKHKFKGEFAMYFHCQTNLVETFRKIYPELTYQGNRAIVFNEKEKIPVNKIKHCILLALTYNLNK
ncbi:hypothetical protein C6990_05465 [Nitrosopumilus sp. b3]|uniref:DUF1801 domain-containing protein n=1 Tax=Nitrosopumilus sp. b3 TaxID=2109909 RepID=UPI0015F61933|nr:DUF1801 domain-containing protein [Nitrosopumilus sp. b3]KAF6247130.1 hypothetical protein C6990_05465 [Nitrosopumilus sp. b3]